MFIPHEPLKARTPQHPALPLGTELSVRLLRAPALPQGTASLCIDSSPSVVVLLGLCINAETEFYGIFHPVTEQRSSYELLLSIPVCLLSIGQVNDLSSSARKQI